MSGSDGPLETVHVLTTGPKVIPFQRDSRDTGNKDFSFFLSFPATTESDGVRRRRDARKVRGEITLNAT